MGLQVSKPMRVISPVFQACLAYTIRAKLAPLWNKAGTSYMQGRDFLVGSGHVAAIDVELNVTETEICLALRPMMAKLPRCTIADFEVCRPVVEQFFMSQNNVILEYSIENKWCYVLPSLKKGKVVSISHEIPATSPFKTYKDIRRYWKNAYGYRLPDSSAGVLYYNIYFPAIGPTLFTYPEYCIRTQETALQTRIDPAPIINAFITDLRYKLPSVCSTVFEVTPKAQFTNTGLYQSGQKEGCLSDLTLSTTPPPTSVHRIPTRQLTFQGSLSPSKYPPSCTVPGAPHPIIIPSRLPANLPSPVGDLNGMFSITNATQPMGGFPSKAPYGDRQFSLPQHTSYSQPMGTVQRNSQTFRPISQYESTQQSQPPYQATARQGTSFKPVLQDNSANCVTCNTSYINNIYSRSPVGNTAPCNVLPNAPYIPQTCQMNVLPNQSSIQVVSQVSQHIIPRFLPKQPPMKYTSTSSINTVQKTRVVPKFTPIKKATIQPKRLPGVSAFITSKSNPATVTAEVTFPDKAQRIVATSARENLGICEPAITPSFRRKEPSPTSSIPPKVKQTQQTLDALVRKKTETPKPNQGAGKTVKRKQKDDGEGHTAGKKPRHKPKIQEGIDITSLAVNDQLSKVNTITLATWLKDKGFVIKAKDKKADLIQRVMEYIHLNSTED